MSRLARLARLLALSALTACGSTPAAAPAADVASDAAADASADAAADATPDAALDTLADTTADGATDTAADAATPSPAAQDCAAIAQAICAAHATCCSGAAEAGCLETETDACLAAKFAELEDASAAGTVVRDDAAHTACLAGLQSALQACDLTAVKRARSACLYSWRDLAAIGQPCAAAVDLQCGAGQGRCDPVSPTDYVCAKAGAAGDACKLTQPCALGLDCRNTQLTRALECAAPGSSCHLSDKCPEDKACENGQCVAPPPPSGQPCISNADCGPLGWCSADQCVARAAKGASCASTAECQLSLSCQAGQCEPKLCQ